MSKKWGYKAGESRIFDVKEAGDLPEGWSPAPVTDDGADKDKGSGEPPAPVTDDGADKDKGSGEPPAPVTDDGADKVSPAKTTGAKGRK